MKFRLLKYFSSFLLFFLLVLPARAQEPHPCQAEAQKFCADAKSFPDRMHCLEGHRSDLSQACQSMLSTMRARGETFRNNCGDDVKKLCAGLEGHPLMDCLDKNSAALSPACSKTITEFKKARKKYTERIPVACKPDVEKFCQNVTPGEGRLAACLNQSQLTSACRDALEQDKKAPEHE